ncbi:MAG: hypothetical protein AAGA92_01720 [Planctomycetota bacterium]
MTLPESSEHESPLDPQTVGELSRLISAACDRVHTPEQETRLNVLLANNPAARHYYLRFIALHSSLSSTAGSRMREEAEGLARRLAPYMPAAEPQPGEGLAVALCSPEVQARRGGAGRWSRSLGLVAALAVCLLVVFGWQQFGVRAPQPGSDGGLVADAGTPAPAGLVATVSFISSPDAWANPNDSLALESGVRGGQTLELAEGELELTYDSGVRLRLIGPVEYLVRPAGGELRNGGLVAFVPEAGHGFTVETPNGKVVDLGTEFGVLVDDFGVSEVSVFSGKVEAYPTTSVADGPGRFELTKGDSLQWTRGTLQSRSADARRFLPTAAARRLVGNGESEAVASDFRNNASHEVDWRVWADARSTPAGLEVRPPTGAARRPYLLSQRAFDPSLGPVTVSCDVVFPEPRGGVSGLEQSVSILTRAADVLGAAGTEWEESLATCVRCCFRGGDGKGDGVLEAATKHEGDRELTNISWRGFRNPIAGERYRLSMRDDGMNVAFTVSLTDDPSVRKTVRCRSLFSGYQNFVAIEGCDGGLIVENVRVSQEPTPDGLASLWPAHASSHAMPALSIVGQEAFDQLGPLGAELVLADSFEGDALDPGSWKALGNVEAERGAVRLGAARGGEHIDTWRQRPYLLTRQEFSPGDERLTVVGRVLFADNFLSGYGGSFAVMTRASDRHSSGPGWHNSILTRGVRSNFWPLGLSSGHSLEIHERPSPKTITLLAAESFSIDPRSRLYLFRLVDDGPTLELPLLDAADPEKRMTLVQQTSGAAPGSGRIGFESCWGSPVLLDDVQIYRGR